MEAKSKPDTRSDILAAAQQAIAAKGYSAFSFREIAAQLGIKSASVHYHFPTKADLGLAVATQYRQEFEQYLLHSDAQNTDKIERLVACYYAEVQASMRMTVCIMLAAERENLPAPLQQEIGLFYLFNMEWLQEGIMARGYKATQAKQKATQILALLQGALIGAKSQKDPKVFTTVVKAIDEILAQSKT